MPQMSPLFWMNLFIILILNYLMVMILINSIFMKFPKKFTKKMNVMKKFMLKW